MRWLSVVFVLAGAVFAQPEADEQVVRTAVGALENAQRELRYAEPPCQGALAVPLLQALVSAERSVKDPSPAGAIAARDWVKRLASLAAGARCGPGVDRELNVAFDRLGELARRRGDGPRGLQVRFRPPDFKHQVTSPSGALGVELKAAGIYVDGAQGRTVRVVLRWRGADPSRWSEAAVSEPRPVPGPTLNTFFVTVTPYDVLRGLAGPDGVVTARLSVYAEDNAELGFTEVSTNLPPPAVAPPVPPPPPGFVAAPVPPPIPAGLRPRDCGTGVDPGCQVLRNGLLPLDAEAFSGFTQALKGTPSELSKLDMCRNVLATSAITALQLGVFLDAFHSELNKLDLARAAAPRVVNPKAAFGLANKFNSSLNKQAFTQLMAAQ